MAKILTQAQMQTRVRTLAGVEGMDDRYTPTLLNELFLPHYLAYREFVSKEGHPHFLTKGTVTTADQELVDPDVGDALTIHSVGVELDGGGDNPTVIRLDPIGDTEVHAFAGSEDVPRFYRMHSDPDTGLVSITVYPKPDESRTYRIDYLKDFDSAAVQYPVHAGWDKIPLLQTAIDVLRREHDFQSVAAVMAEIRELRIDVKNTAERISRRSGQRSDVNAYTNSRQADRWGRYGY